MLCGDLNGKEIQRGGDISIHIADSLHSTAETNTTLYSNYTPIEKKKEKVTVPWWRWVWGLGKRSNGRDMAKDLKVRGKGNGSNWKAFCKGQSGLDLRFIWLCCCEQTVHYSYWPAVIQEKDDGGLESKDTPKLRYLEVLKNVLTHYIWQRSGRGNLRWWPNFFL